MPGLMTANKNIASLGGSYNLYGSLFRFSFPRYCLCYSTKNKVNSLRWFKMMYQNDAKVIMKSLTLC